MNDFVSTGVEPIGDQHTGTVGAAYSTDTELLRQCEASGQMSAAQVVGHGLVAPAATATAPAAARSDVDRLVDRFLTWPVPASVSPDGTPGRPGRTGTNLLSAEEARQMFEFVLGDAAAKRCAGCDLPNGCPEFCRCEPKGAPGVRVGAPGSTDAERAAWLADKIGALGDYAKEAAAMLRRWPSAAPAATEPPSVYDCIQTERDYQDRKWGTPAAHPHEVGAWLALMSAHLQRAQEAWAGANNDRSALIGLRKVLALGVACAEQHGLPSRSPYMPVSDGGRQP